MRARSVSIYAKQSPYTNFTPDTAGPDFDPLLEIMRTSRRNYSPEEFSKLFEDFGPIQDSHLKDVFSGDFKSNTSDTADNCATTDNTSNTLLTLSQLSSKTISEDIFEEEPKTSKMLRAMVIGAQGTGKRSLINALYPGPNDEIQPKQNFDLITRKIETDDIIERYHFWLKEVQRNYARFETVMSVYYKTCNVFFLVYDTHDRTSFECLDQEIMLINQVNITREPHIILIGNRQGRDGIVEVGSQEATLFQEKYGIQKFLEVEISFELLNHLRETIQDLLR